jgi:hypothetical protein
MGTLLSFGTPPAPAARPLYLAFGPGTATNLGCTLASELAEVEKESSGEAAGRDDPLLPWLVPYIRKLFNSGVGEVAVDNNISSNGSVATLEKQIRQFLSKSSQYFR